MPKPSTRALGTDPKDRRRKSERSESSDVSHIRWAVLRDTKAAERGSDTSTIATRVNTLTAIAPTIQPDRHAEAAEQRARAKADQMAVESQQRRRGALAKPCRAHGAPVGEWCWPDAAARGTRAVCGDRWARGAGALIVHPIPLTADDHALASFAASVRNAQRDARLRAVPRHPDRGPITPPRFEVTR